MRSRALQSILGAVSVAALLVTSGPAWADMTLTPVAAGEGFLLTTFADGFPNNSVVGPIGIGFPSGGGVVVSSYAEGRNVRFATDTDGQHYPGAGVSSSAYSTPSGIASVGTHLYQALQSPGQVIEIDSSGNFVQLIVPGLPNATGVTANPLNGHLYVSTPGFATIYDVDPIAKTAVPFLAGVNFDGMTIRTDGTILYGANLSDGSIEGYNTTTHALVFDSGFVPGGVDGSALGTGTLAGKIYVNTNSGTLVEIDLTSLVQRLIASGGSRGDLVEIDPNGSLLLTQTDRVLRLTAPSGGGFGGVPEPGTAIVSLGLVGVLAAHWRRYRRSRTDSV